MSKVITFGEIMLRLSPQNQLRFAQANNFNAIYGGGEANVAVSLANYGIPVEYVTRIPNNEIAKCAMMELRKYNVGTQHVLTGGDRLGIYFLEIGAVTRGAKVVYDRAHSSFSEIKPGMVNWDEVFEGASWFHWSGISPAVSQSASDVTLEAIEAAFAKGLTISCDLNFREQLWKYTQNPGEILRPMLAKTHLLNASEFDAKYLFNIESNSKIPEASNDSLLTFKSVSGKMQDLFPNLKYMVKTTRVSYSANHNTYAAMLYNGTEVLRSKEYNITHIVDRIGAGDSFMGALLAGMFHYKDDQKALDFAVTAAAFKHTIFGDVNLATKEEVERIMSDGRGNVAR